MIIFNLRKRLLLLVSLCNYISLSDSFCFAGVLQKFYFAATCGPPRKHQLFFPGVKYKLVQLIFLLFLNCLLAEIGLVVRERKTAQHLGSRCVCYFSKHLDFQVRKADLLSSISNISIDRHVRLTLNLVLHRQMQD